MQFDMTPINPQIQQTWGLITEYTAAKDMAPAGPPTVGRPMMPAGPPAVGKPMSGCGCPPAMGIQLPVAPRSKVRRAIRMISPAANLLMAGNTMGQDEEPPVERSPQRYLEFAGVGMLAVGMFVLAGAGGYFAGKAMAPTKSKETFYKWLGVPVGMFGGVLGLGVMGFVASR